MTRKTSCPGCSMHASPHRASLLCTAASPDREWMRVKGLSSLRQLGETYFTSANFVLQRLDWALPLQVIRGLGAFLQDPNIAVTPALLCMPHYLLRPNASAATALILLHCCCSCGASAWQRRTLDCECGRIRFVILPRMMIGCPFRSEWQISDHAHSARMPP